MTFQEFIQNPRVQGLLLRACGASGFIGTGVLWVANRLHLPVPDPGTTAIFVSGFVTEGIEWTVSWYRNNPNNILRRLIVHINGNGIDDQTKAEVAKATSMIPGVQVHVDTSFDSPAPEAVQQVAQDSVTPDVVVMGPGGPVT